MINHSQTLISFGLDHDGTVYNPSELACILQACTQLTQLGVNLGTTVHQWRNLGCGLFGHFPAYGRWSHVTQIEASLVSPILSTTTHFLYINSALELTIATEQLIIAAHPKLQLVRILDPSFIEWLLGYTGWRPNNFYRSDTLDLLSSGVRVFVDQALRYLYEHGSKVRCLGWKPHDDIYSHGSGIPGDDWLGCAGVFCKVSTNDTPGARTAEMCPADVYKQDMGIFVEFGY